MIVDIRGWIWTDDKSDELWIPRTERALAMAGIREIRCAGTPAALLEALQDGSTPLVLARAGSWLVRSGPLNQPRPSATGIPLVGLGLPRGLPTEGRPDSPTDRLWHAWRLSHGGDLSSRPAVPDRQRPLPLPPAPMVYLEPAAARFWARASQASGDPWSEWKALLGSARVVHLPSLDAFVSGEPRVVQVITSLQRGGAERMALDLALESRGRGVPTLLVTLGCPTRKPFDQPPGTIDLSDMDPESQIRRLSGLADRFGADVIHAHLVSGEMARSIAGLGWPLIQTLHNTRQGWPQGITTLEARDSTLLVGCSKTVSDDLEAAGIPIPVRTVWNGIRVESFTRRNEDAIRRREWRDKMGIGPEDLVLIAVANPRPQKRLERLPAILDLVRRKHLKARLVIAGEASGGSPVAAACVRAVQAEVDRLGLADQVHWTGPAEDVAELLAGADTLVSTSSHEGLSLSQLEAISMGIAVVSSDTGGIREYGTGLPHVLIVPIEAPPEDYAAAILGSVGQPPARPALPESFHLPTMARRYHWLYRRAIARHRSRTRARKPEGLWLITNNFSTGGAQSSARRLLSMLSTQGIRVRAATLQEDSRHPTPGSQRLLDDGIPVFAAPTPEQADAQESVCRLLEAIDADPPEVVVFWNAIAEHKLILADALFDLRLFDVSPGEMFFASLHRWFRSPRVGLPYQTPADYGNRLSGVIVKYAQEVPAAEALGAPVHVIPNGVPIPVPKLRPARPSSPDRRVFGTAARIHPQKRLEELLSALRLAAPRLPPHMLRIAGTSETGTDDYAEQLRRSSSDLCVEWVGEVSDMAGFLGELDWFVMVSEPAGCPNASLEAMAAGLAVIATDVGGASEQVIDGQTGRLAPRGDPEAMARALVELAWDSDLRSRMGKAGLERIRTQFSLERMAQAYRVALFAGHPAALRSGETPGATGHPVSTSIPSKPDTAAPPGTSSPDAVLRSG